MTKREMQNRLRETLAELQDREAFKEKWEVKDDEFYPFVVGWLLSNIDYVAHDGQFTLD